MVEDKTSVRKGRRSIKRGEGICLPAGVLLWRGPKEGQASFNNCGWDYQSKVKGLKKVWWVNEEMDGGKVERLKSCLRFLLFETQKDRATRKKVEVFG